MDDLELLALYTGYGYQVRFVEYGPIPEKDDKSVLDAKFAALNKNMAVSMEWAYGEIRYA